ncbi:hypothetical protein OG742_32255 [Streptomyces sp. NBC_00828]|uniref:hypothetical protein n=1 Tax=Streptomyces sp. NBC_00828 TaxID=2903678 RepID=UPI003867FBC1
MQSESDGLKNNEIAKYCEYRTKRLVLTEDDRLAASGPTLDNPLVNGVNYTSTLTSPLGATAPATPPAPTAAAARARSQDGLAHL